MCQPWPGSWAIVCLFAMSQTRVCNEANMSQIAGLTGHFPEGCAGKIISVTKAGSVTGARGK